jgi:hypothetical protein
MRGEAERGDDIARPQPWIPEVQRHVGGAVRASGGSAETCSNHAARRG